MNQNLTEEKKRARETIKKFLNGVTTDPFTLEQKFIPLKNRVMLGNRKKLSESMRNKTSRNIRRPGTALKKRNSESLVQVTFNGRGGVTVTPTATRYVKSRKPYSRTSMRRYLRTLRGSGITPRHPVTQRPFNKTELAKISKRLAANSPSSSNINNRKSVNIYIRETRNGARPNGQVDYVTFPSKRDANAVAEALRNQKFTISNYGKKFTFRNNTGAHSANNDVFKRIENALHSTGRYNKTNQFSREISKVIESNNTIPKNKIRLYQSLYAGAGGRERARLEAEKAIFERVERAPTGLMAPAGFMYGGGAVMYGSGAGPSS
tara:strand:- start:824 stop:1786 length:963 start_codon:yes stop_codon:yes gene_type:complete